MGSAQRAGLHLVSSGESAKDLKRTISSSFPIWIPFISFSKSTSILICKFYFFLLRRQCSHIVV